MGNTNEAMNEERRAVWERYVAAWKADTASEQRALVATCLDVHCKYTDPLVQVQGWDALLAYMKTFHEQVPGGHFITEWFLAHHGRSIAKWKMLNGAGAQLGEGVSYGEYDAQNRLTTMTGFFEAGSA